VKKRAAIGAPEFPDAGREVVERVHHPRRKRRKVESQRKVIKRRSRGTMLSPGEISGLGG